MPPGASCSLFLHPIHGSLRSGRRGIFPLRIREIQAAETVVDRQAVLYEILQNVASLKCSGDEDLHEASIERRGISLPDFQTGRRLWFPLMLSQLVDMRADLFPKAAGLIAMSCLMDSPSLTWTRTVIGEVQHHDVWVFVVVGQSLDERSSPASRDSVLKEATAAFGLLGAIRGDFVDHEIVGEALGEGAFGIVRLMRQAERPERHASSLSNIPVFAAKFMKTTASDADVFTECGYFIAVQNHPNIANFLGLFCTTISEDQHRWTLIMEAHVGGDVMAQIKEEGRLSEPRSLSVTRDVLNALRHIHHKGIIHRDVKPENVIIANDGRGVLIDFGVSVHISESDRMLVRCGSPGFIAPEILRKAKCKTKSDVFSCGVVLYVTISGIKLFVGSCLDSLLRANAKARVTFPPEVFSNVSVHTQELIRSMLKVELRRRPSAALAFEAVSQELQALTALLPAPHERSRSHLESEAEDRDIHSQASQDRQFEAEVEREQEPSLPSSSHEQPPKPRSQQTKAFSEPTPPSLPRTGHPRSRQGQSSASCRENRSAPQTEIGRHDREENLNDELQRVKTCSSLYNNADIDVRGVNAQQRKPTFPSVRSIFQRHSNDTASHERVGDDFSDMGRLPTEKLSENKRFLAASKLQMQVMKFRAYFTKSTQGSDAAEDDWVDSCCSDGTMSERDSVQSFTPRSTTVDDWFRAYG